MDIKKNWQTVNEQIKTALLHAHRPPHDARLIAVSKTQPSDAIRQLAQWGQRDFGENYVQEFVEKYEQLKNLTLTWHFIGALQSNKTQAITERADWVHSIEREKIAQRLSRQRPESLPPLNICLQINISGEASKSGVPPETAIELARAVHGLPKLRLRGLMCLPEATHDEAQLRAQFHAMNQLFTQLRTEFPEMDTLSMGMSQDLTWAILEGAHFVRVGTAIFGARKKPS